MASMATAAVWQVCDCVVFIKVLLVEQKSKSLSFVLEKWKDTGLSHMSHSRTIISAIDAQQNTSFSSSVQLPAMELTTNLEETKASNTIESNPVETMRAEHTPILTSTDNLTTETLMQPENLTVDTINQLQPPTLAPNQDTMSRNSNNLFNNSTNILTPRTIKRIALAGGDIILEEEEEELDILAQEDATKLETMENVIPTQTPNEVQNENTLPKPTATQPQIIVSQRPTPVYVNASVLHQKKNPSYGQNINTTPDNKNSTKILTKPKL